MSFPAGRQQNVSHDGFVSIYQILQGILILKHGQQSEVGKKNIENASSFEQQIYNPVIDFDEFKDQIVQQNVDYY